MDAVKEVVGREQYLTFFLAGEEYAITILRVREIIQVDALTKVPSAPPWVPGVLNLRGHVVPVVDLAVKFGQPACTLTRWTCVVVVEVELDGEDAVMGILADQVSQVVELAPDEIEPAPPFGTQVRLDYLVGMGRMGKKFVLILDSDRVLSANELLVALSVDEQEPEAQAGDAEGSADDDTAASDADEATSGVDRHTDDAAADGETEPS